MEVYRQPQRVMNQQYIMSKLFLRVKMGKHVDAVITIFTVPKLGRHDWLKGEAIKGAQSQTFHSV